MSCGDMFQILPISKSINIHSVTDRDSRTVAVLKENCGICSKNISFRLNHPLKPLLHYSIYWWYHRWDSKTKWQFCRTCGQQLPFKARHLTKEPMFEPGVMKTKGLWQSQYLGISQLRCCLKQTRQRLQNSLYWNSFGQQMISVFVITNKFWFSKNLIFSPKDQNKLPLLTEIHKFPSQWEKQVVFYFLK